jgi:hypothetical protein
MNQKQETASALTPSRIYDGNEKAILERVRVARSAFGSQQLLSGHLGINLARWKRIESGDEPLGGALLRQFAKATGFGVDFLLGRESVEAGVPAAGGAPETPPAPGKPPLTDPGAIRILGIAEWAAVQATDLRARADLWDTVAGELLGIAEAVNQDSGKTREVLGLIDQIKVLGRQIEAEKGATP